MKMYAQHTINISSCVLILVKLFISVLFGQYKLPYMKRYLYLRVLEKLIKTPSHIKVLVLNTLKGLLLIFKVLK